MNKTILIGRLTKDPELRYTPAGTPVCNASIAVRRPTAKDGETDADFINLVVWGVVGENLAKYMVKGGLIGVEGRIQVSNYQDKDGVKRWKTEVVASSVEFLGNPRQEQAPSMPAPMQQPSQQQFGYEVQFNDSDLPFLGAEMMKKNPPCRDCIMRVVGCHSWCPIWLRWKRMHDEMVHDAHEEKRHAEEFARRKRYYFKYLPKK